MDISISGVEGLSVTETMQELTASQSTPVIFILASKIV